MKKIILFILTFLSSICLFAQETATTNSLDVMRSNGKIYVVVAVVVVILLGLFFYVWKLDKKISKLEKENKQ